MTTTPTLQPHQQRVVDERGALSDKLTKLVAFVTYPNPIHSALDNAEKQRLSRQVCAMAAYLQVLDERIEAFGQK